MSTRSVRTSSRSGLGSVNSPPPPLPSTNNTKRRPRNPFGSQFTYSPAGGNGFVSSDILKFAIFSRDLSPNDEDATGDELTEPILYFYPSDIAPQDRIKFMNTVLGLGDFMRNFSSDDTITSVHFEASRLAIYECEPNIFFVLEVSSPQRRPTEEEMDDMTEKQEMILHASDEASDALLQTIVRDAYALYRLFRGNIGDMLGLNHNTKESLASSPLRQLQNIREERRKALRDLQCVKDGDLERPEPSQAERMRRFQSGEIDEELALLASQSPAHGVRKALRTLVPVYVDGIDFGQLHFFHGMDGFTFFPVEKDVYMNVHSFVTSVEAQFPQVRQVSLTYSGRMVWSTMDRHHARLILRFVRYHEMISDRKKGSTEQQSQDCGFMSTIRGIWVQAETTKPTESESESESEEKLTNDTESNTLSSSPSSMSNNNNGNGRRSSTKSASELQIFAPPVLLQHFTSSSASSTTSASSTNSTLGIDANNDVSRDLLATVPTRGARSMTAYQRTTEEKQTTQQSPPNTAPVVEAASKLQQKRIVHRLVVYKRGPMLLMLVVDATDMSNQAQTPFKNNSTTATTSSLSNSNTLNSNTDTTSTSLLDTTNSNQEKKKKGKTGKNGVKGVKVLGDGVSSMPMFCRLLHSHAGKPLQQLMSMLEAGYNSSSSNSNNNNNNNNNNNGSTTNSNDKSSSSSSKRFKDTGKTHRFRTNEYRFVYYNNVNLALKINLNSVSEDMHEKQRTNSSSSKNNNNKKSSSQNKKTGTSPLRDGLKWPMSPSELSDAAASELDHAILR